MKDVSGCARKLATRLGRALMLASTLALMSGAMSNVYAQLSKKRPAAGDRIRVVVPATDRTPIEGRILDLDADMLHIDTGGQLPLVIPRGDIQALFVHHERRTGLTGTVIGGLAGSVVFGGLAAASWEPCEQTDTWSFCFRPASRGSAFGRGAALGAVPGLLIGMIVGSLANSDEWRAVDLDITFATETLPAPVAGRTSSPTVRLVIPLGR